MLTFLLFLFKVDDCLFYVLVANFWRGSEITELLIQWNGLPTEAVGVYRPQCVLST